MSPADAPGMIALPGEGRHAALRRFRLVFLQDFRQSWRRPIFWILILVLLLTAYGLSTGNLRISSGDSQVGGTKAWVTSQFAVTQMFTFVVFLFYSFFVAIAAGMAVIQDDEFKIGEILNATPLRPREYVWGRFLGIFAAFLAVLGLHMLFAIFFGHVFPHAGKEEFFGPFAIRNYVMPALLMGVPTILLMAGTAFAMGASTRKPILVFVFPVAMILLCGFFVWNWSPSWLDPKWNKLLMLVDPAGFRWLNETWLKVDRGVDFYNSARVPHDGLFWLNRVLAMGVGLLSVVFAERRFAASLERRRCRGPRGSRGPCRARRRGRAPRLRRRGGGAGHLRRLERRHPLDAGDAERPSELSPRHDGGASGRPA